MRQRILLQLYVVDLFARRFLFANGKKYEIDNLISVYYTIIYS
jgi:hypothetical protein